MVITILSGQLGNTMFQYSVIKTIAEEKGIPFRYYRIPTPLVNSTDPVRGSELDTIFPIPPDERVHDTSVCTETYEEPSAAVRVQPNYRQYLFNNIRDNQLVVGVFATPKLIEHNLPAIRRWFTFPESAIKKAQNCLKKIISPDHKSCAVHFRVGNDYFALGYRLHKSYWIKAAEEVLHHHPNTQFICVYDKKTRAVTEFIKQFHAAEYHSSLVDDMAFLTQTDINIVCNSTFSIMGALLNPRCILGVCPSSYPPPEIGVPENVYSKNWIRIKDTKRDLFSKYALLLRNCIKIILRICRLKQS